MSLPLRLIALAMPLFAMGAAAPDLLPLKHGVYVPVGRACKGASNADIVNYWGGRSSIGAAQGTCTIRRVRHVGSTYTYSDTCRDVASGEVIGGDPITLTISGTGQFTMGGTIYRYCGPKVQF